jgi:hypothetical protein
VTSVREFAFKRHDQVVHELGMGYLCTRRELQILNHRRIRAERLERLVQLELQFPNEITR